MQYDFNIDIILYAPQLTVRSSIFWQGHILADLDKRRRLVRPTFVLQLCTYVQMLAST